MGAKAKERQDVSKGKSGDHLRCQRAWKTEGKRREEFKCRAVLAAPLL